MISYRDQIKNQSLLHYVKPTSIASYHEHWQEGKAGDQCEALKKAYEDNPEGLTDREALLILRARGVNMDAGTVPARRHDLNKVWLKIKSYAGADLPSFLVVSNGRRKNPTGKMAEVWGINPELVRERYGIEQDYTHGQKGLGDFQ